MLRTIHAARAHGMKVMLGSMVETSLALSAAAQLAPLADYLDLDGHWLLAYDPFDGAPGERGAIRLLETGPGSACFRDRHERASQVLPHPGRAGGGIAACGVDASGVSTSDGPTTWRGR